ncbi:MAG: hypothetical protein ACYDIC_05585 [Desulfobaccales bacterium]
MDANWPDLSDAYHQAESFIDHQDYSPPDPTWDEPVEPSYPFQPPEEPQISQIQQSLNKEIKIRENIKAKLAARREVFRVALEKLQRGQNWQAELGYWVEESQAAQLGALWETLGLLVGIGGPVEEAINTHRYNAAYFWERYLKNKGYLEKVNLALRKGRLSTKEGKRAAQSLLVSSNDLTTSIHNEVELAEKYKKLSTIGDKIINTSKFIELVKETTEKHNLLLAAKVVENFILDGIIDLGLVIIEKNMIKAGMLEGVQYIQLANFLINYGYNSLRFYCAFVRVHSILGNIENVSKISSNMGNEIHEATNQIKVTNDELIKLKQVQGNDKDAKKILHELKHKQFYDAYIMGIDFVHRTESYAPGEPIEN